MKGHCGIRTHNAPPLKYKLMSTTPLRCRALWGIVVNNAKNQVEAVEAGGIEVVAAALGRFPDDKAMQTSACGAISCIVWTDAGRREKAVDAGIEPLLRHAYTAHDIHAAARQLGRMNLDIPI